MEWIASSFVLYAFIVLLAVIEPLFAYVEITDCDTGLLRAQAVCYHASMLAFLPFFAYHATTIRYGLPPVWWVEQYFASFLVSLPLMMLAIGLWIIRGMCRKWNAAEV